MHHKSALEGSFEGPGTDCYHLHHPAGVTKKDGPSAGVAMVRSPFSLSLAAVFWVFVDCAGF